MLLTLLEVRGLGGLRGLRPLGVGTFLTPKNPPRVDIRVKIDIRHWTARPKEVEDSVCFGFCITVSDLPTDCNGQTLSVHLSRTDAVRSPVTDRRCPFTCQRSVCFVERTNVSQSVAGWSRMKGISFGCISLKKVCNFDEFHTGGQLIERIMYPESLKKIFEKCPEIPRKRYSGHYICNTNYSLPISGISFLPTNIADEQGSCHI